jgi:ribosomal protein L37AE/L43A
MTQVLCKDCYTPFSVERFRLGYDVCLECGDTRAHAVTYCSAPINKSNYMLITNVTELAQLNPKRTTS